MRSPFVFVLFVVTPLVEMMLLVELGRLVGFWPTVGLVVLTGVIGASMARRQGLKVWSRFQASLADGGLPTDAMIDGLIILVSAALLLTPGVITDLLGFLGLLPVSRALVRRFMSARLRVSGPSFLWTSMSADVSSSSVDREENPGWRGQAAQKPKHREPSVG